MWSSDADVKTTPANKAFKINNIINDNGIISIEGELSGVSNYSRFRVSNFTDDTFSIYYKYKSTAYNYEIKF